jgi:hypothetical protein
MLFHGIWRHAALMKTDVSEEHMAPIFWVTRFCISPGHREAVPHDGRRREPLGHFHSLLIRLTVSIFKIQTYNLHSCRSFWLLFWPMVMLSIHCSVKATLATTYCATSPDVIRFGQPHKGHLPFGWEYIKPVRKLGTKTHENIDLKYISTT